MTLTLTRYKWEVGGMGEGGVTGVVQLGSIECSWDLLSFPPFLSRKMRNENCERGCEGKST